MNRRYDIDWLRVLATLLLFVFHTAMVFNPAPFYHIRNDELSFALLVVSGFVSLWHMPLFFLLAGWSLHRSVSERGAAGVLRERVQRLFVPLAVGIVLFMPAIKYLELSSGLDLNHAGLSVAPHLQAGFRTILPQDLPVMAPFDESFLEFLPTFFTRLDRFTWAHLWFVAYLFTFTLLYLPAMALLRGSVASTTRPTALAVYAPIVPLAAVQLVLRPHWPGIQNLYDDWANVAYYSVYLWGGFVLARSPALEARLHAEWRRALAIGLAACLVLLGAVLGLFHSDRVLLATSAVAGWCFVVAILGLGNRFLRFGDRALEYLSEAAFPVYVLHQAAIVVPGYFLLRLPLGVGVKFVLVLTTAVALTFAVYELVVRRHTATRRLFGMRPLPRPDRAPATMPLRTTATLLVALAVVASAAGRAAAASPIGRWYAEGGAAQVDVAPCGEAICARIVWLRSPFDENGCGLTDRSNPDATLQGRPIIGLQILDGLKPAAGEDGTWAGGSIYDPTSGRTYRCTMRLDGSDRLRVRGWFGIELLGRTTTWLRVGAESRMCNAAVSSEAGS
jgi:glucans biosynthesis protein C